MPIPLAVIAGAKVAQVALPVLLGTITQRQATNAQKTASTGCADQVERDMAKNRDTYLGDPARTAEDQRLAIQIFDSLANELLQCCGRSELGDAGRRCISERIARDAGGNWIGGTHYDWPGWYLYPILSDKPAGGSVTGIGVVDDLTSGVARATGLSPWIAFAALAILLYVLYRRAQA